MSEVLRTTSGYLDELVDALQSEPRRSSFSKASLSQLRTFADDGWALLHDLEDVLLAMDSRLDPYSVGDLDRLLSLFDLGRSGVAFRPMKIAKDASLFP
ncbi:MAG TPA: hypothetical protein PLN31_20635, partial [Azoarcus taiwanensis]|nr:hypothetical protein [Azoarcus taiwanensis]